MAILRLSNGTILENFDSIALELASLHVAIRSIAVEFDGAQLSLLAQDIVDESAKQHLLSHPEVTAVPLDTPLWWDLLNLHPGSGQLPMVLPTYDRYHIHDAPENFYVLSGSAIVGFVRPDGTQMQLRVEAQDYLHIPANVEHWFSVTAALNFKAVRYFTTVAGWMPQYTGTPITDRAL